MMGVYNINKLIGCCLEYGGLFDGYNYRIKLVFEGNMVAYSRHEDYGSAIKRINEITGVLNKNGISTLTLNDNG
jgi:hypothetical protein